MTTPADQPADFTNVERQTANRLLASVSCAHPETVDITTAADADRVLLCPWCDLVWREREG